jgi:hypothetical protein
VISIYYVSQKQYIPGIAMYGIIDIWT